MKKTILFVEFCPISGSSQGLLTEITYLQSFHRDDIDYIVVGPKKSIFLQASKKMRFPFYELDVFEPLDIKRHPVRSFFWYIYILVSLLRIALIHHIDIIHCNHYMWSIYANPLGFILNKPVIIHLKDVWLLEPKVARILMKFNPKTHYIAVSQYVRRLFEDVYKIDKRNMVMIYDGIDGMIFSSSTEKERLSVLNDKRKTIVMMSRIVPERDIDIFIDIAALIHEKYPDILFHHYGYSKDHSNRDYFNVLKTRVASLGLGASFRFHPYESHPEVVAKIFRKAFLSIVPGRQFALPNTAFIFFYFMVKILF